MKVVNPLSRSTLIAFVMSLAASTLNAQSPVPTSPHSGQAELSKVEEWVLSQGNVESVAPEIAAIFGLGSDRLPVKVISFRTSNGIDDAFAVSTNSAERGIVLSALKTMANSRQIYFVGNAWLTDVSGTLHATIQIDASGARILPNDSHAAEFNDLKAFFLRKAPATSRRTAASPSPRVSATAAGEKKKVER